MQLKNQTRYGTTVVFPDDSEFCAKIDLHSQNVIASMYANSPSCKIDK